jgi:hypothetical protein
MSTSISGKASATAHPTRQQLDELDALLKRMLDLPVNRLDGEEGSDPPAQAAEAAAAPVASPPEPMRGPHNPEALRAPAETPAVNYTTAEEEEADLKPRVVSDAAEAPPKEPAETKPRPPDWVPLTSTWRPSARTWKPLSEAWKQAQAAISRPDAPPAPEAEPSLAPEPAPTPPAPEQRQESQSPAAEPAPTPDAMPEPASATPAAPAPVSSAAVPRWVLMPLLGFNAAFDVCLAPWGAPGRWLRGRAGRMVLGAAGLLALAAALALALGDWFGWTG